MAGFQHKIMRQAKKKERITYILGDKTPPQTVYERACFSRINVKNFKVTIINVCKELKKIVIKEVKGDMIIMSHQTNNINKEIDSI